MRFFNTILDVVFPATCGVCGASGRDLCAICLSSFPAAERESEKWIFPLYDYRHLPVRSALRIFKYKGKKRLARIFAEALYGKIIEELSELSILQNFNEPVLVPIPLSKKRYRERGYNQAELICNELVKINEARRRENGMISLICFKLSSNSLIKSKNTEYQAKIKDRRERLKNLEGSFSVRNAEEKISTIKGKNIILIDDITTTGATLSEARKTLKQAGARKVIAFTVAH